MIKKRLNGLYLVIDPQIDSSELLEKVHQALDGGADILQIWNHWPNGTSRLEKEELIAAIVDLAEGCEVPVLINDDWKLLQTTRLDGVHFDAVPDDFGAIKRTVGHDFIAGITCSNDLDVVRWADTNDLDYISFCAMFPSPSVSSCAIVRPETVRKARAMTDLPLFLSGGITPEKIDELSELDFDGVAVISGLLVGDKPRVKTAEYKKALAELDTASL